jgi:hypothetical protein
MKAQGLATAHLLRYGSILIQEAENSGINWPALLFAPLATAMENMVKTPHTGS